jgi:hypothetical protein
MKKLTTEDTENTEGGKKMLKIRMLCQQAINARRRYKKIHPDAFQVWACSEKKGAAALGRKIISIIKEGGK